MNLLLDYDFPPVPARKVQAGCVDLWSIIASYQLIRALFTTMIPSGVREPGSESPLWEYLQLAPTCLNSAPSCLHKYPFSTPIVGTLDKNKLANQH